jgi:hypothetical protein
MNIRNIIIGIVIVVLISFDGIVLYKYRQIQNRYWDAVRENLVLSNKDVSLSGKLSKNIILQQESEGLTVQTIKVQDVEHKREVPLQSLIKTDQQSVLCFRFRENDCDACVQQSLSLLKEVSEYFPEKGIAILSGYGNVRQFQAYAQSTDKHLFLVYNVDTVSIAAENQEQPYFFVLTHEYKIQNVFIVCKEDAQLTAEYLHSMAHKYWAVHKH